MNLNIVSLFCSQVKLLVLLILYLEKIDWIYLWCRLLVVVISVDLVL